eukprot:CAMPEP_0179884082 /NCGR_PEP_ID=MMETSP0982-20121206/29198_1 /TAXON_ID=483367 /ORGANISM="non described non described, Strain CCMP 2436" /LENGTH=239 /DNA_ID=CAMNT_0021778853 /DNA_START=308 /DNA_END=1029 /DNA_ORIENTATION=+
MGSTAAREELTRAGAGACLCGGGGLPRRGSARRRRWPSGPLTEDEESNAETGHYRDEDADIEGHACKHEQEVHSGSRRIEDRARHAEPERNRRDADVAFEALLGQGDERHQAALEENHRLAQDPEGDDRDERERVLPHPLMVPHPAKRSVVDCQSEEKTVPWPMVLLPMSIPSETTVVVPTLVVPALVRAREREEAEQAEGEDRAHPVIWRALVNFVTSRRVNRQLKAISALEHAVVPS